MGWNALVPSTKKKRFDRWGRVGQCDCSVATLRGEVVVLDLTEEQRSLVRSRLPVHSARVVGTWCHRNCYAKWLSLHPEPNGLRRIVRSRKGKSGSNPRKFQLQWISLSGCHQCSVVKRVDSNSLAGIVRRAGVLGHRLAFRADAGEYLLYRRIIRAELSAAATTVKVCHRCQKNDANIGPIWPNREQSSEENPGISEVFDVKLPLERGSVSIIR